AARGAPAPSLDEAIAGSRSQGGICVILGDADPTLAAKLATDRPFLVRWLVKDASRIDPARESLLKRRLYGVVSVDLLRSGSLPFTDQLVSLVIAFPDAGIDEAEMLRILRPGGELITQTPAG